jgi:hypothetical protein
MFAKNSFAFAHAKPMVWMNCPCPPLPLREGMLDHAAHRDAVAVARAVVGCMSSPAGSCR